MLDPPQHWICLTCNDPGNCNDPGSTAQAKWQSKCLGVEKKEEWQCIDNAVRWAVALQRNAMRSQSLLVVKYGKPTWGEGVTAPSIPEHDCRWEKSPHIDPQRGSAFLRNEPDLYRLLPLVVPHMDQDHGAVRTRGEAEGDALHAGRELEQGGGQEINQTSVYQPPGGGAWCYGVPPHSRYPPVGEVWFVPR